MTNKVTPRRLDVVDVTLIGGREKRHLEIVDYDERWPTIFLDHQRRIQNALTAVSFEIEHIGSTSVPGLAAKPIVDCVVIVEDITAEEDYLAPLIEAGYELRVRERGHRMVRAPARDVHVHILERGAQAFDEYLLLRDHLRADADDRGLYEATKRTLVAQDWDDMNAYSDAKTEVITAIKDRARATHA